MWMRVDMSLDLIHRDLRSAARLLPGGFAWRIPIPLLRRVMTLVPLETATGVTIVEQQAGAYSRVRIYSPIDSMRRVRPGLLWIHGGGYIMGDARQDDGLCAIFARRLDMTVVSVDYRLAPEHPYPAPLDDCFAALETMHREASSWGIDPTRYVIGGASAGGGLAAALTLRAHDQKIPAPRLQLLVYPMIDDRTIHRQIDGRAHRIWDQASNLRGWTSYLGREPAEQDDLADHAAAARRIDLSGLPPAWIGVGTADLFCDEDVTYAERLREAGVPTELDIVDGAFHGFDRLVPKAAVSQRFLEAQIAAMDKALRP